MGRNFFHGDVKNQCFLETVYNVDTRKITQLCSTIVAMLASQDYFCSSPALCLLRCRVELRSSAIISSWRCTIRYAPLAGGRQSPYSTRTEPLQSPHRARTEPTHKYQYTAHRHRPRERLSRSMTKSCWWSWAVCAGCWYLWAGSVRALYGLCKGSVRALYGLCIYVSPGPQVVYTGCCDPTRQTLPL